jgi:lysozyme family protein
MSKFSSYLGITTIAIASAIATSQAYADTAAASSPVTYESAPPAFIEQPSTLTRAEVLADLEVWKASGLADLQRTDSPDYFSDQYARASALYAALHKSPHFATLVQSIAAKRGEVVAGTTSNETQSVQ